VLQHPSSRLFFKGGGSLAASAAFQKFGDLPAKKILRMGWDAVAGDDRSRI
jgi:hypothetical protein